MATNEEQDVVRFIRDQHAEIKRLFSEVETRRGDDRREAFECLVRLLAVHETAEEEVVYPALRSADPTGDAIADARIGEESEAKRLLAALERAGTDSDSFPSQFAVLRAAVLQHADTEEQTVLPLLQQEGDAQDLLRMGKTFGIAETLAPTHPHPHGPNSALGNIAVGPMAAVIDRTRDAIHHVTH